MKVFEKLVYFFFSFFFFNNQNKAKAYLSKTTMKWEQIGKKTVGGQSFYAKFNGVTEARTHFFISDEVFWRGTSSVYSNRSHFQEPHKKINLENHVWINGWGIHGASFSREPSVSFSKEGNRATYSYDEIDFNHLDVFYSYYGRISNWTYVGQNVSGAFYDKGRVVVVNSKIDNVWEYKKYF